MLCPLVITNLVYIQFFWIYIYIFMSFFGYLLYLDWICHHQLTEHEKTSGLKKSKSPAVF